ncbi:MAG TPA: helix-turn-helix domain-containing protein [Phycisphaerae bacterium]|nr:helix-turn-helix domain-containing protein [Phycisphaerae bacterium]
MGTKERRQREAARRREAILDAARKVFWQRGYQGATMPQIARQAELAPGTLYLYFPGKDALYVELLLEGYDRLIDRIAAAPAGRRGPKAQAAALIDAFFDFAREHPEYFHIIFFVLQREAWRSSFPAEQVERLAAKEAASKQAAADLLDRIAFAPARRRAHVVDAVWGMLAGVVFHFRSRETFDDVAAEAKELLLAAVFGRG